MTQGYMSNINRWPVGQLICGKYAASNRFIQKTLHNGYVVILYMQKVADLNQYSILIFKKEHVQNNY